MPGAFTDEAVRDMRTAHATVLGTLRVLTLDLLAAWLPTLTSPRAQEYLKHGVARRVKVIARTLETIFSVCPPDRTEILESDERCDIEINLHAFVINVHGLLDNLAWVTVHERSSANLPHRNEVSLFKRAVQRHLPEPARDYLNKEPIPTWYTRYSREYRDALAHRIPLYVPPYSLDRAEQRRYTDLDDEYNARMAERDVEGARAALDQQGKLGKLFPVFVHSFNGEGATPPVLFHPQLIADSRTVLEIVRVVSPIKLRELEARLDLLARADRRTSEADAG
jgi:hypothetical protein